MERGDVETVKDFYKVLKELRKVRKKILESVLEGEEVDKGNLEKLQKILVSLKSIPENGKGFVLFAGEDDRVVMQLEYEIEGLRKDLIYLKQGDKGLQDYLEKSYEDFEAEKKSVVKYLKGKRFDSFVADRDGTLNDFSERYISSIQTIYNAIYVEKFLKKFKNKILVTSAPLTEFRFVNILPEDDLVLAGSRGRNFVYNGKRKNFYVPWKEGKKLAKVHSEIKKLLREYNYKKLNYVGSGLQEKFGGITVARQDYLGSVDKRISRNFLEDVKEIVKSVDPQGEYFGINDTGLDIEINLKWGMKIFDKGSGLSFILNNLNKNISQVFICGNSESDLALVERAKKISDEISVVFVTEDKGLKKRVKELCSDAKFVSSPDILVSALKEASRKIKKSKGF